MFYTYSYLIGCFISLPPLEIWYFSVIHLGFVIFFYYSSIKKEILYFLLTSIRTMFLWSKSLESSSWMFNASLVSPDLFQQITLFFCVQKLTFWIWNWITIAILNFKENGETEVSACWSWNSTWSTQEAFWRCRSQDCWWRSCYRWMGKSVTHTSIS